MIITSNGSGDTSLEPAEHLAVPDGFTWPTSVKKLITSHDAAWNAWAAAELAQIEALADLEAASEKDRAALIDAVAADQSDPGTAHQDTGRRAAVYCEEKSRQAATKVNALVVQIREALPAHRADLIAQAVKLERDAIAGYARLIGEAQAIVEDAERVGRSIGGDVNWLLDVLGEPREHAVVAQLDSVQWPPPFRLAHAAALAALERLEAAGAPGEILPEPAGFGAP